VWREGNELCVAMEYVEGETLEELRRVGAGGKEFSIEVGVRVIVDVLAGLSAIHTAGQGGSVHGEVTATNVIVGFDGTTRLVRPFHGAVAGKVAEPDWFSYAAPEVVKGSAADVRADLYAVGVLLWETLSRRKLFPKATREGRVARTMPVGKPTAPTDAGWAAPLGAVAERALANDASARYTTAAEMAAAVRLAVRSKLAMPPRVSAAVDKLASERILARRNANALPDPSGESNRVSMPGSRPSVPPEAVRALSAIRPSSRPPTPKPGPVAVPVIPRSPPLPKLDAQKAEARPRPMAPPIAIAPPLPKPPSAPPPSEEILDIAIESVREPTPAAPPVPAPVAQAAAIAMPMPMPMLMDGSRPAGVPATPSKRNGLILIAVAGLFALIAVAAVIRAVVGSGDTTTPVASTRPSAKAKTTATATSTATATVATVTTTTSAATSAAPSSTTTATPESSGSAEPEPSATATSAPTDPSHRPHARPRPTYDPMGI
jgi:serine/threonine-protein kinase